MPKYFKKIFFLFLFIFSIFVNPINISALTTDYHNINDSSLEIKDNNNQIEFLDFKFIKNLNATEKDFGLEYTVSNHNKYSVYILIKIEFYDINYNLIAEKKEYFVVSKNNQTIQRTMNNTDIIKTGYTVDDIYYYKLKINTQNQQGSASNYHSEKIPRLIYSEYDYILNKYDVNIVVNEDNSFDITETIEAYFNVNKHGIFRKIPIKNNITRLDGTSSKNIAQISNIDVDELYTVYKENGYQVIKIGDPLETIKGSKTYKINYTYKLNRDTGKDYDEFYFNIIGDEWDTIIRNISFTISMPKEFDASKIGFSSGPRGSTDSSNIEYKVNDTQITGRLKKDLNSEEALTIRLELPEEYFEVPPSKLDDMKLYTIILLISFVLIAYLLWKKYGKDDQIIETVEFYPPQGFNSLDIGLLYKGKANSEDVTSLLIYLANLGYINISEYEKQTLFGTSKKFKITKLKEYDGNDINELAFLTGLFSCSTNKQNPNEVTSSDLYDRFYVTMNKILKNTNKKTNIHKIFEKKAFNKSIIILLMIISTICLITIPPVLLYGDGIANILLISLVFPGLGFSLMFSKLCEPSEKNNTLGTNKTSARIDKIAHLIFGIGFGGIPWFIWVLPLLLYEYIYLVIYIIGFVCLFALVLCYTYLPKRTKYGNEMLGKLNGFRNFLETSEKDKLEAMVLENPTYFYDILPYTYVLGVSDTWINKFETINLKAPDWYDGKDNFDIPSFRNFMDKTMSSANSSMSSGSSGSSSGGGSSGGGSGGGGGGSW